MKAVRDSARYAEVGLLLLAGVVSSAITPAAVSGADIDFERDVQPILKKHCLDCHGDQHQRSRPLFRRDVQGVSADFVKDVAGDPPALERGVQFDAERHAIRPVPYVLGVWLRGAGASRSLMNARLRRERRVAGPDHAQIW